MLFATEALIDRLNTESRGRQIMKTNLQQFVLITLVLLSFLISSCEPQIKFEDYADYAIEMNPNSLALKYIAAKDRTMLDTLPGSSDLSIYPAGEVTFSYTLANITDKNYRFTACLYWKNQTKSLGCDKVRFIGKSSVSLSHTVLLSPDSGELWVEGTDILVEPIGNDTRPQYFAATLTVATPCPSDESCCSYEPDGSCGQCIDKSKNEVCP